MVATRKQFVIGVLTVLLVGGFAAQAAASGGLVGQCADCHTMHNSQAGQPVALQYGKASPDGTRNQNLLKFDCLACHAQDPNGPKLAALPGGSVVPQVFHGDTSDLAAGNFKHIAAGGNRKGHNVVDLVGADTTFTDPPGFRHTGAQAGSGGFDLNQFTCAGSMGCHGIRGQVLSATAGSSCDPFLDPECQVVAPTTTFRTGLAAFSGYEGTSTASPTYFSGAHHSSYDGYKSDSINPKYNDNPLAHSYRFIARLRGYGNEAERWQNNSADSHNEYQGGYFSTLLKDLDYTNTTSCQACHINGTAGEKTRLNVPSSSMTGFCVTCHSTFHSSGATNGTSGAFLRHPSDYVIPNSGEYANYTAYDVTAPVGRPTAFFAAGMTASAEVNPGTDMVMCLSCHVAHASPHDGMLRFDYAAQTSMMRAGSFPSIEEAQAEGGCLACHTTKGVLPQNR